MKSEDHKENVEDLLKAIGKAKAEGGNTPVEKGPLVPSLLRTGPEAGDYLGDFHLLRELGRGGMGAVYEAHQESLNRRVAIKILYPGLTSSKRALSRFGRETEAVARLSHPNIIPIYAVGNHDGLHYFAMRYLVGPDLAEVIDRLREARKVGKSIVMVDLLARTHPETATPTEDWDPDATTVIQFRLNNYVYQAVELIAGIAEALDVAHQQGVIHRDVKPGNLVFDRGGNLVITDFGIAKSVGDISITRTGEFLGSPGYISPEQAMTRRLKVDHRTDVYSLGVTLYEFLTLEHPFLRDTFEATLRAILTKDPVPPCKLNPKLPKDVETIVLKAMEKDPDQRFSSAREMALELRRILNFEAIRVSPISPFTRAWRIVQRNRTTTIAATIGVLLGISILWLTTLLNQRQQAVQEKAEYIRASASAGAEEGALADFISGAGGFDESTIAIQLQVAETTLDEGDWEKSISLISGIDKYIELALLQGDESIRKFLPSLSARKVELIRFLEPFLNTEADPVTSATARRELVHYLEDKDAMVVKNAAVVLGRSGGGSAVFPLGDALSLWKESPLYLDSRGDLRIDFVEALGFTRHPDAITALSSLGGSPSIMLSLERIHALVRIATPEAKALLQELSKLSDKARVRRSATDALRGWNE